MRILLILNRHKHGLRILVCLKEVHAQRILMGLVRCRREREAFELAKKRAQVEAYFLPGQLIGIKPEIVLKEAGREQGKVDRNIS